MTTPMATLQNPPLPPDAAGEPRFADYRQLLSLPRVREYLQDRLVGLDLQDADGQDLIEQTYAALWRRRNDESPPDTLPRLLGLAKEVLQGKVVDFFRHKAVVQARIKDAPLPRGEKPEPGQCSGRDQLNYVEELRPPRSITPEMTLQAKQQMEFTNRVADEMGLTDDELETMQAVDCGELTIEEAAKLRGMKASTLRSRLNRIRNRINEAWRKYNLIRTPTGLVILLLLLLLTYAIALGIARRNDPPPQQPPQRTVEPRQPRGEVPTDPVWPGDVAKTVPQ
jgi:RNA polymerase sigma factor (sigma-70 family)